MPWHGLGEDPEMNVRVAALDLSLVLGDFVDLVTRPLQKWRSSGVILGEAEVVA